MDKIENGLTSEAMELFYKYVLNAKNYNLIFHRTIQEGIYTRHQYICQYDESDPVNQLSNIVFRTDKDGKTVPFTISSGKTISINYTPISIS
jgi:hypothetical protein